MVYPGFHMTELIEYIVISNEVSLYIVILPVIPKHNVAIMKSTANQNFGVAKFQYLIQLKVLN